MKNFLITSICILTLGLTFCSTKNEKKSSENENYVQEDTKSQQNNSAKTTTEYYASEEYPSSSFSNAINTYDMVDIAENKMSVMANMSVASAEPATGGTSTPVKPFNNFEQKLIKTGNISYRIENIITERNRIDELIKNTFSYISDEVQDNQSGKIQQNITIRIPSENFDLFINQLTSGVKVFDYKNIYVEDVTDQYTDTEARIKTKKAIELKYIALLDRAKTIPEILELEKQIGYLRTDIESAEAHLKTMSNQIAYSTLHINIYELNEDAPVYEEPSIGSDIADSFAVGWSSVVDFFLYLIQIWPNLLIITVLAIFIRIKWRKWRQNSKAKREALESN